MQYPTRKDEKPVFSLLGVELHIMSVAVSPYIVHVLLICLQGESNLQAEFTKLHIEITELQNGL